MKKIIYIFLLITMPVAAFSQDAVTKELADKAYAEARYADAIEMYETLIAEDGGTLPLYYNLGNAYYRDNQFGKAILNYERALRIDADDEDSKANLEFVQSKIKDRIPTDDVPFYKKWGNAFFGMFSQNVWGVIGIFTFVVMLAALFFFLFKSDLRKISLSVAIVCLLFTILANVSAYGLGKAADDKAEAVIMDEMVVVKSSPDSSGTELTKIHEGLKVKVLDDSLQDWMKIEANNGNRVIGWVKAKSLEKI